MVMYNLTVFGDFERYVQDKIVEFEQAQEDFNKLEKCDDICKYRDAERRVDLTFGDIENALLVYLKGLYPDNVQLFGLFTYEQVKKSDISSSRHLRITCSNLRQYDYDRIQCAMKPLSFEKWHEYYILSGIRWSDGEYR